MKSFIVLMTLLSPAVYGRDERNCSFESDTETLRCSVRTLESFQNDSAFGTKSLKMQCSNVFLYESILRTNHFGYLPDLLNLDLNFCKIRKIPALAFSGLSGLTSLRIVTENSEWPAVAMEIGLDAFTGLNSLRDLVLTHNNVWTLPPASFCGLINLASLNLSVNYLQDTADLGFASSDFLRGCRIPLKTLDLSRNTFTTLPSKAFGQLDKLETLILDNNDLSQLEDDAFGELDSLRVLSLANNQLVALPPHSFANLGDTLQELHLQNNSLRALAPGIFSGLQRLTVLNLSRNDIGDDWLNGRTFESLKELVALDLSGNRIEKLESSILSGLESLQILDLTRNRISTIAPETFFRQSNLRILLLSHNLLDRLLPRTLDGLSLLNSLSLDNNRLKSFDSDNFGNLTRLQDLALNNNQLTRVPESLNSLELLRMLDLGENGISEISETAFRKLDNLYGLRLSGNGISTLPESVFRGLSTLQVLNLAHNEIETLPQTVFNPLTELRMLRLDNNRMLDINGLLTAQSELRWLNISANRLQWFDYAFIPKQLKWLDVHMNQIEDLGNYYKLKDGFSLTTLDASQNKIAKITTLSVPNSLELILLNDNEIEEVQPHSFLHKPGLKRVEMARNLLRRLPLASLAVSSSSHTEESSPEFFLGDNPFFCDCEMEYLKKINQIAHNRQHPMVMDLDQVRCHLQEISSEMVVEDPRPITQIESHQFLCRYQAHCFALCMCCDFFACDCRMQCPDGCTCYHDSTWSANAIQCSNRGHVDVPPLIPMDATSIRLDGNNFTGTLESQAFIGRKRVTSLYLNSSQISAVNNQTFNGLSELQILHLDGNFIRRLEGYEFANLTSLTALYLQYNLIEYIHRETFQSLFALQILELRGNKLTSTAVWNYLPPSNMMALTLSENEWTCRCDFFQRLRAFVLNPASESIITDVSEIRCVLESDKSTTIGIYDNRTCSDALAVTFNEREGYETRLNFDGNSIPIAVAVVAICVILAATSVTLFVFRTPLRVWLHSKYGLRLKCGICSDHDPDFEQQQQHQQHQQQQQQHPHRQQQQQPYHQQHYYQQQQLGRRLYDAYVSYSVKDEDFVRQILAPRLERDEPHYKLCLQHRDVPGGADTLTGGISQLCAKQVLVVSKSYLESEWIRIKLSMPKNLKTMKKKNQPILVLLEETSALDLGSFPEFSLLLKAAVVVRWNQTGFWNKLRFYLPDKIPSTTTLKKKKSVNDVSNGNSNNNANRNFIINTVNPKKLEDELRRMEADDDADEEEEEDDDGWPYDCVMASNDSSASTRSTIIGGGSPRTLNETNNTPIKTVINNPLEGLIQRPQPQQPSYYPQQQKQRQWPESEYSWTDHTYQTISGDGPPPIYHTLESSSGGGHHNNDNNNKSEHRYNQVGSLDVMLPDGRMVPATLVRNAKDGRIVPLVHSGPSTVTFPRTVVYKSASPASTSTSSSPHNNDIRGGGGGYLV